MLRYILHRVGQTLVVVLGVTVIIFFVLRVMPGDPVQLMFGEGDDANLGESRLRYEQQLGLDQRSRSSTCGSWARSAAASSATRSSAAASR